MHLIHATKVNLNASYDEEGKRYIGVQWAVSNGPCHPFLHMDRSIKMSCHAVSA